MIVVACALFSCDKPPQETGDRSVETTGQSKGEYESASKPTLDAEVWRVGRLDVRQGASGNELHMPSRDKVRGWLTAAIDDSDVLESSDEASDASFVYRAAVVDEAAGIPADEQPFVRIRVQGRLTDPSQSKSANDLMALGFVVDRTFQDEEGQPTPDMLREFVREAVDEYIAAVQGRFRAYTATDSELGELMQDESLPPEALLTAIHEARDRGVESSVPALQQRLLDETPAVVVAAAAALASIAPERSASKMVEAAGQLGREREYAALHRLIFILGDVRAPVVTEYLQGLSGHKIPDIRRAAEQVLERRAKQGGGFE
jgi:hypothetical protein